MGLITGLLTLPLAPVRGATQLASLIQAQAEDEAHDQSTIRNALDELESAREEGALSEWEIEEAENALLERLIALRGFGEPEGHGGLS